MVILGKATIPSYQRWQQDHYSQTIYDLDEMIDIITMQGFSAELILSSFIAYRETIETSTIVVPRNAFIRALNVLHDVVVPNAVDSQEIHDAMISIASSSNASMVWRWIGKAERLHDMFFLLYRSRNDRAIYEFIRDHECRYIWGFVGRSKDKEFIDYNNIIHLCILDGFIGCLSILCSSPNIFTRNEFNQRNKYGDTPLMIAARSLALQEISMLLTVPQLCIFDLDSNGQSAIGLLLIALRSRWSRRIMDIPLLPSPTDAALVVSSMLGKVEPPERRYNFLCSADRYDFSICHLAVMTNSVSIISTVLRYLITAHDGLEPNSKELCQPQLLIVLSSLIHKATLFNSQSLMAVLIDVLSKSKCLAPNLAEVFCREIVSAIYFERWNSLLTLLSVPMISEIINRPSEGVRPLEMAVFCYFRCYEGHTHHAGRTLTESTGNSKWLSARHSYYLQVIRLLLRSGANPLHTRNTTKLASSVSLSEFIDVNGTIARVRGHERVQQVLEFDNLFAVAAALGWTDVIRLFLSDSSCSSLTSSCVPMSEPLLHSAMRLYFKIPALSKISAKAALFAFAGNLYSSNPILAAVKFSQESCLSYLLSSTPFSALVDHIDISGLSPLAAACESQNVNCVEWLLRFNAAPDLGLDLDRDSFALKQSRRYLSTVVKNKKMKAKLNQDLPAVEIVPVGHALEKLALLRNQLLSTTSKALLVRSDPNPETRKLFLQWKELHSVVEMANRKAVRAMNIMKTVSTSHCRMFAQGVFGTSSGSQARLLADKIRLVAEKLRKIETLLGIGGHGQLKTIKKVLCSEPAELLQLLQRGVTNLIRLRSEEKMLAFTYGDIRTNDSTGPVANELRELWLVVQEISERSLRKWSQEDGMKQTVHFVQSINLFGAEWTEIEKLFDTEIIGNSISETETFNSCCPSPQSVLAFIEAFQSLSTYCSSLIESETQQKAWNFLTIDSQHRSVRFDDFSLQRKIYEEVAKAMPQPSSGYPTIQRHQIPLSSRDKTRGLWWDFAEQGNWDLVLSMQNMICKFEPNLNQFLLFMSQNGDCSNVLPFIWSGSLPSLDFPLLLESVKSYHVPLTLALLLRGCRRHKKSIENDIIIRCKQEFQTSLKYNSKSIYFKDLLGHYFIPCHENSLNQNGGGEFTERNIQGDSEEGNGHDKLRQLEDEKSPKKSARSLLKSIFDGINFKSTLSDWRKEWSELPLQVRISLMNELLTIGFPDDPTDEVDSDHSESFLPTQLFAGGANYEKETAKSDSSKICCYKCTSRHSILSSSTVWFQEDNPSIMGLVGVDFEPLPHNFGTFAEAELKDVKKSLNKHSRITNLSFGRNSQGDNQTKLFPAALSIWDFFLLAVDDFDSSKPELRHADQLHNQYFSKIAHKLSAGASGLLVDLVTYSLQKCGHCCGNLAFSESGESNMMTTAINANNQEAVEVLLLRTKGCTCLGSSKYIPQANDSDTSNDPSDQYSIHRNNVVDFYKRVELLKVSHQRQIIRSEKEMIFAKKLESSLDGHLGNTVLRIARSTYALLDLDASVLSIISFTAPNALARLVGDSPGRDITRAIGTMSQLISLLGVNDTASVTEFVNSMIQKPLSTCRELSDGFSKISWSMAVSDAINIVRQILNGSSYDQVDLLKGEAGAKIVSKYSMDIWWAWLLDLSDLAVEARWTDLSLFCKNLEEAGLLNSPVSDKGDLVVDVSALQSEAEIWIPLWKSLTNQNFSGNSTDINIDSNLDQIFSQAIRNEEMDRSLLELDRSLAANFKSRNKFHLQFQSNAEIVSGFTIPEGFGASCCSPILCLDEADFRSVVSSYYCRDVDPAISIVSSSPKDVFALVKPLESITGLLLTEFVGTYYRIAPKARDSAGQPSLPWEISLGGFLALFDKALICLLPSRSSRGSGEVNNLHSYCPEANFAMQLHQNSVFRELLQQLTAACRVDLNSFRSLHSIMRIWCHQSTESSKTSFREFRAVQRRFHVCLQTSFAMRSLLSTIAMYLNKLSLTVVTEIASRDFSSPLLLAIRIGNPKLVCAILRESLRNIQSKKMSRIALLADLVQKPQEQALHLVALAVGARRNPLVLKSVAEFICPGLNSNLGLNVRTHDLIPRRLFVPSSWNQVPLKLRVGTGQDNGEGINCGSDLYRFFQPRTPKDWSFLSALLTGREYFTPASTFVEDSLSSDILRDVTSCLRFACQLGLDIVYQISGNLSAIHRECVQSLDNCSILNLAATNQIWSIIEMFFEQGDLCQLVNQELLGSHSVKLGGPSLRSEWPYMDADHAYTFLHKALEFQRIELIDVISTRLVRDRAKGDHHRQATESGLRYIFQSTQVLRLGMQPAAVSMRWQRKFSICLNKAPETSSSPNIDEIVHRHTLFHDAIYSNSDRLAYRFWNLQLLVYDQHPQKYESMLLHSNILHYIVYFKMVGLLRRILEIDELQVVIFSIMQKGYFIPMIGLRCSYEFTPLHIAAWNGSLDCLEELLNLAYSQIEVSVELPPPSRSDCAIGGNNWIHSILEHSNFNQCGWFVDQLCECTKLALTLHHDEIAARLIRMLLVETVPFTASNLSKGSSTEHQTKKLFTVNEAMCTANRSYRELFAEQANVKCMLIAGSVHGMPKTTSILLSCYLNSHEFDRNHSEQLVELQFLYSIEWFYSHFDPNIQDDISFLRILLAEVASRGHADCALAILAEFNHHNDNNSQLEFSRIAVWTPPAIILSAMSHGTFLKIIGQVIKSKLEPGVLKTNPSTTNTSSVEEQKETAFSSIDGRLKELLARSKASTVGKMVGNQSSEPRLRFTNVHTQKENKLELSNSGSTFLESTKKAGLFDKVSIHSDPTSATVSKTYSTSTEELPMEPSTQLSTREALNNSHASQGNDAALGPTRKSSSFIVLPGGRIMKTKPK